MVSTFLCAVAGSLRLLVSGQYCCSPVPSCLDELAELSLVQLGKVVARGVNRFRSPSLSARSKHAVEMEVRLDSGQEVLKEPAKRADKGGWGMPTLPKMPWQQQPAKISKHVWKGKKERLGFLPAVPETPEAVAAGGLTPLEGAAMPYYWGQSMPRARMPVWSQPLPGLAHNLNVPFSGQPYSVSVNIQVQPTGATPSTTSSMPPMLGMTGLQAPTPEPGPTAQMPQPQSQPLAQTSPQTQPQPQPQLELQPQSKQPLQPQTQPQPQPIPQLQDQLPPQSLPQPQLQPQAGR